MNRFLVVGHGSSSSKKIKEVLELQGMSSLAKSVKYKYTDSEIVRKILSAHESSNDVTEDFHEVKGFIENDTPNPDLHTQKLSYDYSQIKPQKMWDHLLFDLYLANSDEDWVWQDSKAVSLLDYFAAFDDKLYFVLVYDKPQNALLDSLEKDSELVNTELFYQQLRDWSEYNKTLLQFKRKYPDRCLLVNGLSSLKSTDFLLERLKQESSLSSTGSVNYFYEEHANTINEKKSLISLTDIYVSKNNLVLQTFNELELEADISDALELEENLSITDDDIISALKNQLENKELEILKSTYKELVSKNTSLSNEVRKHEDSKDEITKELKMIRQRNIDLDSVNKELSSVVREDKDNENKLIKELNKLHQEVNELNNSIIIKEAIIYNLKKKSSEVISNDAVKNNYDYNILLSQMHVLQKKLEDVYVENLEANNIKGINKDNTEDISSAALLASPEIVKNDISYRIGSNIIENSKNPLKLLSLSRMVFAEHKRFKKLVKDDKAKKLSYYQDTEETKKIKTHLSFQVGEAVVDSMESPVKIFVLPARIANRVLKFKLNYK